MAQISRLARLVAGVERGVDLATNTLVVQDLLIGGFSGTALNKAILDRLVSLQNGSDVDATYHTHDGRYFTESELGSSSASSGSDLVGDDNTYSNFTPAAATVKGALSGIDTALATSSDGKVKVTATDTTKSYLDGAITAGSGLSKNITSPGADEVLNLDVNVDNSTIEINANALRVKDAGITNVKVATGIAATKIADGSVSNTEFQYLDGVTSAIQTQLNATEKTANKGQANGYASLDGGGKVPVAQLPSSVMTYEGVWNASTNTPTLSDGTGDPGMVYRVSVAGTRNLGSGSITFDVGDYAIYNSSGTWEKSDTTDAVASVNGKVGVVTLDTGDLSENGNLFFTVERAQDAVGTILIDTATIDFTYDDAGNQITADLKDTSVTLAKMASASVDENKLTTSVAGAGLSGGGGTALAVNVDSSTIEINADTLRVKDAGITAAKVASGVFDQATITGGAGSAAVVQSAPLLVKTLVAGESFAANTSFLVRWAVSGETADRVYKADYDTTSSDKFWVVGIAYSTGAVIAGGNLTVVMMGTHILQSSDSSFVSGDVGKPVWLTASGAFSTTAPSTALQAAFKVGMVESTGKIWVDRQMMGVN